MYNKTFRLFISSTFSDFMREREVLQTEVFPELEKYCTSHGYQFQAIDLRWGVNEEAQVDQKTIEICLKEVITCKHYPHPNFLVMLGDRYGWIPLPYAIEKKEFKDILNFYSSHSLAQKLLKEWYQHDENYLSNHSTAYVIKPRTGKFVDFENWVKVEDQLRKFLQDAIDIKGSKTEKQKYFISATEHEVNEGIYSYSKHSRFINKSEKINVDNQLEMEYIYGFIRDINPRDFSTNQSEYFDVSEKALLHFKSNLKKTLLKENLLELQTQLISNNDIDQKYLQNFRYQIFQYLKTSITQQIKRIAKSCDTEKTKSEHQSFKQERLKIFVGRQSLLKKIEKYILNISSTPLIIYAKSGMGKTSLMAKAINNIEQKTTNKLIYRFVGASEKSTNIRTLLISIIREINVKISEELNTEYNENVFNETVKKFISEIKSPTILFIDALDQLNEKNYLNWLPNQLPAHFKLIISILEDEDYKEDSGYLDLFKVKYNELQNQNNFIPLNPLTREDGNRILSNLLDQVKRTITTDQRNYVLNKFEKSGYSPLYLIIIFEEIKKWKSFTSVINKNLEDSVISSIKVFLNDLSAVYHHQELLVSRTMGYIECAKNGLSEKEIIDILSADQDIMTMIENQFHKNLSNKIPIAPWARLYSHLSPFFIEKMSDNVSLITMFHRQFINAIQTNYLKDTTIKEKLHYNLSRYFKDQELVSSEGVYNLRKLSEQAFHLLNSHQLDDLIHLMEQDYIYIKHKTDRFYDCLLEIEQAALSINDLKDKKEDYYNRLISSLLMFLDSYSGENNKLFDFEYIHVFFIYGKPSQFYPKFLQYASQKELIRKIFKNTEFIDDYHLRFLSGSVGYLRRTAKLKEASVYVKQLIAEYSKQLKTKKETDKINKHLSSSYYELGYIFYLRGAYTEANTAFEKSVSHAKEINNEVSEWITKCVMTRVAYYGELSTIEKFDNTLNQAIHVFKRLAPSNHVAKRWIKVMYHHKFEVAEIKNDLVNMKKYYNLMRTNQWNKEHQVPMELHQGILALAEKNYEMAIKYINTYISMLQSEKILKEDSSTMVFYYLGLAYNKKGDNDQAKSIWEEAMLIDDEPGNHAFKRMIKEKLSSIN